MTPTEAAHILAPLHIGFMAARLRIQEARDAAQSLKGREASRALADLEDADDFLIARFDQWSTTGMLAAVEHGGRVNMWPNALPDRESLDAAVRTWADRAGKAEDVEALRDGIPASLVVFRKLAGVQGHEAMGA